MSSSAPSALWVATVIALLAITAGCADFERGDPSVDGGAMPAPDPGADGGPLASFATDIAPLLISGCRSCHQAGGTAGSTDFLLTGVADDDFLRVTALIDTANPPLSRLLRKAQGLAHGGGSIYPEGTPEYRALLRWISQGATR